MKYIMLADLHLSSYSNEKIIKGISEKLYYTINVLENVIKYAKTNNISKIIILGDIIHTKSIIHSEAISPFLDIIRKNREITFIIFSGNHDFSSRSGNGVSALKFLDSEINIKMIYEPELIDCFWIVPWNPSRMVDDIKNGPKNTYLVSHLGLNEGRLNSGISIISDIGLKDIKKYKHAFLGHYHSPQTVGNVTYVGSPIQLDWGEKHEEKRFLVFDTETEGHESIQTDGYKKYFEFNLTEDNKKEIFEIIEKLKTEGHNIKINKLEVIDTSDVDESIRIVDKTEYDVTNRGITSSMSNEDKLDKYLDIKNIPNDRRSKFKEIGIWILNECDNKFKGI